MCNVNTNVEDVFVVRVPLSPHFITLSKLIKVTSYCVDLAPNLFFLDKFLFVGLFSYSKSRYQSRSKYCKRLIAQHAVQIQLPRGVLCKRCSCRPQPATLLKRDFWFSCEFCGIIKNTFFTEHLWANNSGCSVMLSNRQ